MGQVRGRKIAKIWTIAILVITTCTISEILEQTGWLAPIEYAYQDLWHGLSGPRAGKRYCTIVSINDQSLLEHKEEPLVFWGPYFAKAIEVLRQTGVRVIGLDFLFSVSAESWMKKHNMPGSHQSRTYDIPLRSQLAAGNVILAVPLVFNEEGEGEVVLPIQDYISVLPGGLKDLGVTNFYTDPDGVVRRFLPVFSDSSKPPNSAFATLLALRYRYFDLRNDKSTTRPRKIPEKATMIPIGFVGHPGSIDRLSFSRFLKPNASIDPEIQSLKDKIVIITAEYSGVQDVHLTPYSRSFFGREGSLMSGAELHANIVETLLSERFPRPLPFWVSLVYMVAVLCATTAFFLSVSPWKGLGTGLMIGAGCAVLSYFMFYLDRILPIAGVQLALALSYLGALGYRFTGEEKRRADLQRLFGRYVSDEVVEKLLETRQNPDLGGEMRDVTILFADIRNFTTISEKLASQEVVEMLNVYFSRACDPILEQGGTVDKFLGDAVMAVFGAPAFHQDHARRALIAAVSIKEIASDFRSWMRKHFPDRGLPDFEIGIGVHTGEAVIGNIGSAKRTEYTAIGDTVNTASRLEGLTKELGCSIIASADTIKAAGDSVMAVRLGQRKVKGRCEPVDVFNVIGLKGVRGEAL